MMLSALGVLLLVLGNFMSKLRPNWFIGVRTPWTLTSRLSWDKTHRLAGWPFLLMGALWIVAAFFQYVWMFAAVLGVNVLCLIWMIVFSYIVYRRDPHRTSPAGTLATGDDHAA